MITINGEYNSAAVYSNSISDTAFEQLRELCSHPMFASAVIRVMPDCHAGKGCVIGFTSVSSEKIIVPNLVGVDIGCGVMTAMFESEKLPDFHDVDCFIRNNIPSGTAVRETPCPAISDLEKLRSNVNHICETIHKEEKIGYLINSIGTLGGGNHFIEIDRVSDNKYMLAVHTGSRSLGNYICKYFQSKGSVIDERRKQALLEKHKTAVSAEEHRLIRQEINSLPQVSPDSAYITDSLYDSYIDCMLLAKDYAYENRRCITKQIMDHLSAVGNITVTETYDTIHNYVDWYDSSHSSIIIRKGAVSALNGQRLCIPLNMRDGIIVGTGKGNAEWNNSAPHGAGRLMSRSYARSSLTLEEYAKALEGVNTWSVCDATLDEAPQAYKPSEEIIESITDSVSIDFIARTIYNFKAE